MGVVGKTPIRLALVLGIVAVAALLSVGLGSAAPPPTATVVLACERNVNATAHVELWPSFFDQTVVGVADLNCGPDSVSGLKRDSQRIPVSGSYGWANYSMTVDGGGCVGGSVTTLKFFCDANGTGNGATLTVR